MRIRDLFGFAKLRSDIQDIIDFSNIRSARVGMSVIMTLQMISFGISFFFTVQDSGYTPHNWLTHHRIAYILMFAASMQLFIYSITHKPAAGGFSHFTLNISIIIYIICLSLFSIYISLHDYMHGDQIFVFITLQIFITCIFILKPYVSFLISVSTFVIFYVLMKKTAGVSTVTTIGFPLLCLTFMMVSGIQYWRYLRIARYTVQTHMLAEQMRQMSLFDPLTKLKNRLALQEDFNSYCEHNIILMIADIDDFKRQNDCFGHEHGDDVLDKFSRQLERTFGSDSCYRYGGDEFLVLLKDENVQYFKEMAEQCKNELSTSFCFSGGFATGFVHSPEDFKVLMNQADENLYSAKRNGKNQIVG